MIRSHVLICGGTGCTSSGSKVLMSTFEKELEKNGLSTKDMAEKVAEHLCDMEAAFGKQYESLYQGDMLDLSVEIEAMTIACKRDGLLYEEDFERDKENSIDLEF